MGEEESFRFQTGFEHAHVRNCKRQGGSVSLSSGQLERLCVTLESEKVNSVAARPID